MKQFHLRTGKVIDLFAGGGGASLGLEMAGYPVDIAVNHDPEAIALHKINHPSTKHFNESVFDVDPIKVCDGSPVDILHLSPDCTHHSKARGGKPVKKNIRALPYVALKWAGKVKPRMITLENVEEFQQWGKLVAKRCKKTNRVVKQCGTVAQKGEYVPYNEQQLVPSLKNKGETFKSFVNLLKKLGYDVSWKELRACDFGAPTTRKRFFLVARCDGEPIRWPTPTHGVDDNVIPFKTAGECIDFSNEGKSIFNRKKPLAQNTMDRIGAGFKKFIEESDNPYIVRIGHTGTKTAKAYKVGEPLTTICTKNEHLLVTSNIIKLRNGCTGQSLNSPLDTITAGGGHFAEVRAFMLKYYGTGGDFNLNEPCHTITTKDRFALVMVKGEPHILYDITLRMLTPRELYRCQGFPDSYVINFEYNGKPLTQKAQVRMCGNSVPPQLIEAIVRANMPESILYEPAFKQAA